MKKYPLSQEEYLKHPNHCPYCGSWDIEGGPVTIEEGTANQMVSCNICGATYQDHYILSGYSTVR